MEDSQNSPRKVNLWTQVLLKELNFPWNKSTYFEMLLNSLLSLTWSVFLVRIDYFIAILGLCVGLCGTSLVVLRLNKLRKFFLLMIGSVFLCLGLFDVWNRYIAFLVPFTLAFSSFLRLLRSNLSKTYKELPGVITSSIFIAVFGVLFSGVFFIADFDFEELSLTQDNFSEFLLSVIIPVNLVTVSVWVVIQLCCFVKYPSNSELLRKQILENEDSDPFTLEVLSKYPEMLEDDYFTKKIGKHINKLSGFVVGAILTGVQVFSWYKIYTELTSNYEGEHISLLDTIKQSEKAHIYFFYVIATPLLGYSGVVYSSCNSKRQSKIFYMLFLFTMVLAPLSQVLGFSFEKVLLRNLVVVGYLLSLLFWVLMAMVHEQNKKGYQFTVMMCFTGVLLPLAILYPLNIEEVIGDFVFITTNVVLVLLSSLVVLFFLAKSISTEIKRKINILLLRLKVFLGSDFADFIYTIGYIVGYWLLCYAIFEDLSSPDPLILGCLVVMLYSVVLSAVTQNLTLYQKESSVPELPLKQTILNKQETKTQVQLKHLQKKKSWQKKTILSFLAILGTSACLLVNPFELQTFLTVLTGGLITCGFFLFIIEIKFVLRQHGRAIVSYLLSLWWPFVNVPFLCLIPFYISKGENEEKLATLAIGMFFVLLMLFVSTISVTLNIVFKRIEYEKVSKFCCANLKKELSNRRVKCKKSTLRVVFDKFEATEREVFDRILLDKVIVNYVDLEVNEVDLKFAKKLVVYKKSKKLKKKIEKSNLKREKKESELTSKFMKSRNRKLEISCLRPKNFLNTNKPEPIRIKKPTYKEKYEPYMTVPSNSFIEDSTEVIYGYIQTGCYPEGRQELVKLSSKTSRTTKTPEVFELQEPSFYTNWDFSSIKKEFDYAYKVNHLKKKPQIQKLVYKNLFTKEFSNRNLKMSLKNLKNFIEKCNILIEPKSIKQEFKKVTRNFGVEKLDFELFYKSVVPWIVKSAYNKKVPLLEDKNKFFVEFVFKWFEHKSQVLEQIQVPEANYAKLEFLPKPPTLFSELLEFNPIQKPLVPINLNSITTYTAWKKAKNPKLLMIEDEKVMWNQVYFPENLSEVEYSTESEHSFEIIEPEISKFSKAVDYFLEKLNKLSSKVLGCLEYLFLKVVNLFTVDSGKLEEKLKELEIQNEMVAETANLPCPDWESLCEILGSKIETSKAEAEHEIKGGFVFEIRNNSQNFSAIVFHTIEIVTYCWTGMYSGIDFFESTRKSQESFGNFNISVDHWDYVFYSSIGSAVVLVTLVFFARKHIKKGTLGISEDGSDASFPSIQYLLSKFCQLLSKTMYLNLVCNMLSGIACNFDEEELIAKEMECFSQGHSLKYFVPSVVCFLAYYPIATLLYPSMQYQNRNLDIKFDSTFLVLESQGKIIIASFGVFFNSDWVWMKLSVMILVFVFLFILSFKMQPCICKSYNVIKIFAYLLPLWTCGCSLLVLIFENLDDESAILVIVRYVALPVGNLVILVFMVAKFLTTKSNLKDL